MSLINFFGFAIQRSIVESSFDRKRRRRKIRSVVELFLSHVAVLYDYLHFFGAGLIDGRDRIRDVLQPVLFSGDDVVVCGNHSVLDLYVSRNLIRRSGNEFGKRKFRFVFFRGMKPHIRYGKTEYHEAARGDSYDPMNDRKPADKLNSLKNKIHCKPRME